MKNPKLRAKIQPIFHILAMHFMRASDFKVSIIASLSTYLRAPGTPSIRFIVPLMTSSCQKWMILGPIKH